MLLSPHDFASGERYALEEACRMRSQAVYLGGNSAVCRVLGRYKMFVDTNDVGFASNLLLDGFWEMWLTMFIARIACPGMVTVDVGANFGYYTLLMADVVGPQGRVFAIEPNPGIVATLGQSVSLNGFSSRTEIICAAAGNRSDGIVRLFVPSTEPKNAAVVGEAFAPRADGTVHDVPCRKLDDVLGSCHRCDLIKIDAEGAEQDIIDGLEETITRFRPRIVLEFNAHRYQDPEGFLDKILRHYTFVNVVGYSGTLEMIAPSAIVSDRTGEDCLLYFDH